jgi:carbon storage regulator
MSLVLSRKPGSSILIGPDIEVTILEIRGQQVRIAISAPAELRILRDELLDREEQPARWP